MSAALTAVDQWSAGRTGAVAFLGPECLSPIPSSRLDPFFLLVVGALVREGWCLLWGWSFASSVLLLQMFHPWEDKKTTKNLSWRATPAVSLMAGQSLPPGGHCCPRAPRPPSVMTPCLLVIPLPHPHGQRLHSAQARFSSLLPLPFSPSVQQPAALGCPGSPSLSKGLTIWLPHLVS